MGLASLVVWFVCFWLVARFFDSSVGVLFCGLASWSADHLVGLIVGWLVGWFVVWLGRLFFFYLVV